MGYRVYACDVSQNIINHAQKNAKRFGAYAEFTVGDNQTCPYENDFFDLSISVNSIHYVSSYCGIKKTIREFARIFKPNSLLVLLTCHPDNWIVQNGIWIDKNKVEIKQNSDFRNGDCFYVFTDKKELLVEFESDNLFYNVQVGENQLEFFDKTIRNYVLVGYKK